MLNNVFQWVAYIVTVKEGQRGISPENSMSYRSVVLYEHLAIITFWPPYVYKLNTCQARTPDFGSW